jgi:hypothetical protein
MSQTERVPKLGDIVYYHEKVRQDVWDPPAVVTWPAIVTEVLAPGAGEAGPRLRVTAFKPFEKPAWDLTAYYSSEPAPGCWNWPETDH